MSFIRRNSGALFWFNLTAVLLFWLTLLIGGAITPGYSQANQATSELSALGQPYWWLNSLFGILPSGVAVIVAGLFLIAWYGPGKPAAIGGWLTVLSGTGFVIAAIVRCDVGCQSTGSAYNIGHVIGGALAFTMMRFAPLAFAMGILGERAGLLHLASLILGLTYWIVMLAIGSPLPQFGALGAGSWQKIAIGVVHLWVVAVSLDAVRCQGRARIRSRRARCPA